MAKSHLLEVDVTSPFISTSETPLWPFHKAVRNDHNAAISMIDLSHFNQRRIFSAKELIRKNPLNRRSYKGWGEWLIWGDIPASSMVGTIFLKDLWPIVRSHGDVREVLRLNVIRSFPFNRKGLKRRLAAGSVKADEAAGSAIGKLFRLLHLELADRHLDVFATMIARSWRFQRNHTGGFSRYLQSVRAAYSSTVRIEDAGAVGSIGRPVEVEGTAISSDIQTRWQQMVAVEVPLDQFSRDRARVNRVLGW
jgi:hypothetical protein